MDNGLVLIVDTEKEAFEIVLILVVMEDGLVQCMTGANSLGRKGLNPYCSGQWSRTRLNLRLLLALQS